VASQRGHETSRIRQQVCLTRPGIGSDSSSQLRRLQLLTLPTFRRLDCISAPSQKLIRPAGAASPSTHCCLSSHDGSQPLVPNQLAICRKLLTYFRTDQDTARNASIGIFDNGADHVSLLSYHHSIVTVASSTDTLDPTPDTTKIPHKPQLSTLAHYAPTSATFAAERYSCKQPCHKSRANKQL
jgi:hypothetical protein